MEPNPSEYTSDSQEQSTNVEEIKQNQFGILLKS